jgi:micrococcal nuclease
LIHFVSGCASGTPILFADLPYNYAVKTLGLLVVLFLSSPAFAHQVIGISDGDTLTLLVDRKPLKIRLANIDAPEKTQAFGERSKQSLSDFCFGRDATYKAQTIDKYGRTVARVTCGGVDVNRAQVERGMAWVYDKYNTDRSLPTLQANAKAGSKGLWADKSPVAPWEFRHSKPAPAVAANDETCHVGPRGGRYQMINRTKRYGC